MAAYDKDLHAWAMEQAFLLRAGRMQDVDVVNIAEEIESLGKGERRELVGRLAVLLAHLLKWQLQSELRGRSWRLTIEEQRDGVADHLGENPSLRAHLPEALERAWRSALRSAERDTGLAPDAFPTMIPWTADQVLDASFYPE